MPKNNGLSQPFEGFGSPNYTQVPDEVFDRLMPDLSDAELRVVLYIIRRTFGFKRESDNISLKQLVGGITTGDGRVLDRGTGLSKATVARGLAGLREKGVIVAERNRSVDRGDEATTYRLRFKGEANPVSQQRDTPPVSQQRDRPVSQQRDTQDTGRQETGNTLRKAHAKKLDGETEMTVTPADPSGTAQTVSDPARATTPEPVGEGELRTHPIRAVVEPASASAPPTQHSEPPPTRTRVLADPGAKFDPSAIPPEREGEGFQRLRDQALKLREEVRREQEEKGSPSAHTPVRLGEVLASDQAATSALTRTDPPPRLPPGEGGHP